MPSLLLSTPDYRELLAGDVVDVVYCAVPHHLHETLYTDVILSGKALLGEKPFGLDLDQNKNILAEITRHPKVFVRCSSEFPFYPAAQALYRWVQEGRCGKLIDVRAAFLHSSDLDLEKPVNWKRKVMTNGAYGCLGDLGLHTEHLIFRLGIQIDAVQAVLSRFIDQRPDGSGGAAVCETWDNAVLLGSAHHSNQDKPFPVLLETKRLAPGSTNAWSIEVHGLDSSVKFSTEDPNALYYTMSVGREQAWARLNIGSRPQIATHAGSIFEFGFADAMLQMLAAFVLEWTGHSVDFGCATPEETHLSHVLHTAALLAHDQKRQVSMHELIQAQESGAGGNRWL
ncbi:MAG: Gfo/Idh/MocA family oxidoreductase [Clostridia bacterium]|nr:Gfo/Idh/MocA family oxidoreductase [Clostridia bacterium]